MGNWNKGTAVYALNVSWLVRVTHSLPLKYLSQFILSCKCNWRLLQHDRKQWEYNKLPNFYSRCREIPSSWYLQNIRYSHSPRSISVFYNRGSWQYHLSFLLQLPQGLCQSSVQSCMWSRYLHMSDADTSHNIPDPCSVKETRECLQIRYFASDGTLFTIT